ncbi:MAG: hypothetical protein GX057_05380 [Clostridiales bacterium]|nr:hypothetical protein [Clostridiales bacterium]
MKFEAGAACEVVSGLIIEYIDGELDKEAAELVERHIETCTDCRKLYRDFKVVCRATAEAAYPVPGELHTRVMTAVRADKKARLRTRLMKRVSAYAGVGIAAMLCIFIGIAAIFGGLDKNADTFSPLSEKMSDEAAEALAMSQYVFNRATALDKLINEASDRSSETEYECHSVTKDNAFTEPDTAALPQPDAPAETKATAAEMLDSSRNNAALLVGCWELTTDSGRMVTLTITTDNTFTIVDTDKNVITGNYTVSDNVISLSYPGGTSEYKYYIEDEGLGLSNISGDDIIK